MKIVSNVGRPNVGKSTLFKMKIVSIVGRPNVGKSTLFNRLTDEGDAITHDISGTTRDRNYGQCVWNGFEFTVIDTGGYIFDKPDFISKKVNEQIEIAINESDIILFVVDSISGLLADDKNIANVLRLYTDKKEIILVPNKVDNSNLYFSSYEFSTLGFKNIFPISSMNGHGTGDLLDYITDVFKKDNNYIEEDNSELPRFAVVGQPNVGKSTLINVLLGSQRLIVNDSPGTTRDSINSIYNLYNKKFILVDTAGIRKKLSKLENIDFYSTIRSIRALQNCDVCLYVIDAAVGLNKEDLKLINLALKYKRSILLIVNKCDLLDKDKNSISEYRKDIYRKLRNCNFIPIIFISALNKKNIFQVVDKALQVYNNSKLKIKTSELNRILFGIIKSRPPYSHSGNEIKINYITQVPNKSNIFLFFTNRPKDISDEYRKFLKNKIYENFNFSGVPISIVFREK